MHDDNIQIPEMRANLAHKRWKESAVSFQDITISDKRKAEMFDRSLRFFAAAVQVSLKHSSVVGDGVTPTCLAILPGASGQIILPDVRHMNSFPFYGLPWYGSRDVVAVWDKCLR